MIRYIYWYDQQLGFLLLKKGDTDMEWGKERKKPVGLDWNYQYEFKNIFKN